jgi:hypothetical protein
MTARTAVDFLLSLIAVLLVAGGLLSERAAAAEEMFPDTIRSAHVESASYSPVSETAVRPVFNTGVPHGPYTFTINATSPDGQTGDVAVTEFEDRPPERP